MATAKRRGKLRFVLILLLIAFVVMQFFRIDKSVPEIEKSKDFIAITKPSKKIEKMLRSACYDCHSYESEYPWYAEVAPFSWLIGDHIKEGREHLNFSTWGDFKEDEANHKLHESEEEVGEEKMPLSGYSMMHGDADLTHDQREELSEWFEGQMTEKHEEGDHEDEDHD